MVSAAIGFGLVGTVMWADAAARTDSAAAAPPSCGNPAPVTAHDGSSAWISLGATCQDADLDHLTFEIVTAPAHGELTEPDEFNNVEYTPDSGYTGPDSFQFRANDGDEVSDTLTIAITVEPNQPPECEEERSFDVEPDRPSPIWVGCFDPDSCCELTYSIVDPPQHGSVGEFDPYGASEYTPEPGYHGPDSFTIKAGDGLANSDVMTVEITVLGPNSPPTCASPLTMRVAKDGSLPLDASIACSDPDGDPIFPVLVTGPRHGTFVFPDDVLTYKPEAGYTGPDRIDYRAVDPRGAQSNIAVLNIIVGEPPGTVTAPVKKSEAPDTLAPTASIVPVPGQRLRDVRTKGLKLLLTSSEAGRVSVGLSVTKATAKRLKLKRKPQRPVLVGSADRTIRAGSTTVSVALTRKARKALKGVGKVKLFLAAVVSDGAGNRSTVARIVKLRRVGAVVDPAATNPQILGG